MPWEYLKTKPFDKRYEIAARELGDAIHKVILDINCGEPNFRKFIKFKKYIANDINQPDDVSGIKFLQISDNEVDVKADIITLFGYGGGEFTGEPLESSTAGKTILRLAKYGPEQILVEMAQKWEDDFKAMSFLKKNLESYHVSFEKRFEIEPAEHYHDKRYIVIFKKNQ